MSIASLLFVPVAAHAIQPHAMSPSPLKTTDEAAPCQVTGGTLTWGVKESFRAYISGSIANGSWEASDGASYTTPNFQWSQASGSIDPATGTGSVSFAGTVHFTGHDDVLDLTFANPTIEFDGDGKASLLLDARSTDATGKVTIDAKQEWVADLTAPFPLASQGEPLTFSDMSTVLTNSGAKAFAGFYEPQAELDPVSVSLDFTGCDVGQLVQNAPPAPTASEPPTVAEAPVTESSTEIPWIPIVIGAVALLVIGVTAGMLISGRKHPAVEGDLEPQDPAIADPATADPVPQSPAPESAAPEDPAPVSKSE
jgi:hypothetical protein